MADKKISALTAATTPLDGTEILPIVQSGSTVKVANNDLRPKQIQSNATSGVLQVAGPAAAATRVMTVPDANFTAARTDAAQSFTGDQTLGTGNLIQGTAAKGINFTANTPAAGMISQLLNWYEEGTWTPVLSDGTNNATMDAGTGGAYVRIGRIVYITGTVYTTSLGSVSGNIRVTGLPFAANAGQTPAAIASSGNQLLNITAGQYVSGRVLGGNTYIELWLTNSAAGMTRMQETEWSSDGYANFAGFYFV